MTSIRPLTVAPEENVVRRSHVIGLLLIALGPPVYAYWKRTAQAVGNLTSDELFRAGIGA